MVNMAPFIFISRPFECIFFLLTVQIVLQTSSTILSISGYQNIVLQFYLKHYLYGPTSVSDEMSTEIQSMNYSEFTSFRSHLEKDIRRGIYSDYKVSLDNVHF